VCLNGGSDAVFRFTLPELQDVQIGVSGGGGGVAIALRPWAQCATGPDDKCTALASGTLLRRSLDPGEYAVIVKTQTASPFEMSLRFMPPTPIPPIDICGDETLEISGGGSFGGMFAETDDDYVLSCHSGAHHDAAYKLTLTEPKDVTITGSVTGAPWGNTPYLSLQTTCGERDSELSCITGSDTAVIRRRNMEPGTYFVLIERGSEESVDFGLDVTVTDPVPRVAGDACETALDITTAAGSVDASTLELDSGTSCGGSTIGYRDANFTFELASPRDVVLRTSGAGTHFAATGGECGTFGGELRCRSGSSPLEQRWRSLPAGRYYVTVATTLTTGSVTASIETSDPTPVPPNERCDGAIDVSHGYRSADTLVDFEDDAQGCSGTNRPDAFYKLVLPNRRRVSMIVQRPASSPGSLFLTLKGECDDPLNLACVSTTGTTPAAISQTLDAGTYHLIVEMPDSQTGDFDIEVFVGNP
jgi:hypothetical protein